MKDGGWLGCMTSKTDLRKHIQTKAIVELLTWEIVCCHFEGRLDSSLSLNVLVSLLLNVHSIITIFDCGLHGRLMLTHNQLLNFLQESCFRYEAKMSFLEP